MRPSFFISGRLCSFIAFCIFYREYYPDQHPYLRAFAIELCAVLVGMGVVRGPAELVMH